MTIPLPSVRNTSGRTIGPDELEAVRQVIETGNLSYIYGKKVGEFERRFADLLGAQHAVAVSSGTAALHTAMTYLDPDPGDEILVSPIADMGTVIPVLYQHAVPVFVDPFDQNMDPALIERSISPQTRGSARAPRRPAARR